MKIKQSIKKFVFIIHYHKFTKINHKIASAFDTASECDMRDMRRNSDT